MGEPGTEPCACGHPTTNHSFGYGDCGRIIAPGTGTTCPCPVFSPAAPVGSGEGQTGAATGTPDAEVEAAAKAMFGAEQCDRHQMLDLEGNWASRLNEQDRDEYRLLARAALAAASGPWAEQLDAANAEADTLRVDLATCERLSREAADAALARNAELERELGQWKDRMWVSVRERAVWSHEAGEHAGDIPFLNCPMCESSAARAELDSLRDRVTALADEWDSEWSREPDRVNLGWAANQLRAAIVRGSDDE